MTDSTYVTSLIAARPVDGRIFMLALRTLRELGAGSAAPEPIRDIERFADVLANRFLVPLDDLTPDGGARLWRRAGEAARSVAGAERLSGAYRRRIEKRIRAGNTGPT
ncbi:hypothetical protein [Streptomyces johnsoniae]|uniref:Uncharacterized protein n=1 Tax=Streptomyces johnsoniae TaxID=3075532 RepID=A0ABU2SC62_9ACTN|nr:hypothetical protein [Streptomyces sp. DSM 41886]MDT0446567.1 hypothetical protein [Streptomyces sp. DSM 41886]